MENLFYRRTAFRLLFLFGLNSIYKNSFMPRRQTFYGVELIYEGAAGAWHLSSGGNLKGLVRCREKRCFCLIGAHFLVGGRWVICFNFFPREDGGTLVFLQFRGGLRCGGGEIQNGYNASPSGKKNNTTGFITKKKRSRFPWGHNYLGSFHWTTPGYGVHRLQGAADIRPKNRGVKKRTYYNLIIISFCFGC